MEVTAEQRRARLALRHGLARSFETVEHAADSMVGLHASDPVTVYLSARARVHDFAHTDLEDALYERRSLVRMLGMRRTMFVVPVDLAAVMDEACTKALAPPQRRRLIRMLEEQGVARDGARWLRRVERDTMAALHERGEATATELVRAVPALGEKLTFGEGKTWGGAGRRLHARSVPARDRRSDRARPSARLVALRSVPMDADRRRGSALRSPTLDHGEASADLLRRWLRAFGPGSSTDIRWWTGWTARQANAALAAIDVTEVALEGGGTGYLLADDTDPLPAPDPWVAFLPSLDPTTMGWKERDWYLGDHAPALFDRNGNAGPTIWADGRVDRRLGADGGRHDRGEAARARGPRDRRVVSSASGRASPPGSGDVRIVARFRTPTDKELRG